MLKSNYLIINRTARAFDTMKLAGKAAVFIGENGKVIDFGVLALDSSVYAALFCDEARNVTFVINKTESKSVVTLIWREEEDYRRDLERLKSMTRMRFSPQNTRINRYAEAVAEKLKDGVKLRITDATDVSDMVKCPECGMFNPAGSMYCMDCGAEIC